MAETGKLSVVKFYSGFYDLWSTQIPALLCIATPAFQKIIIITELIVKCEKQAHTRTSEACFQ